MIDPKAPRPVDPLAPILRPHHVDWFTACHVLAFGTLWKWGDYFREAEARVYAGESFLFAIDAGGYNALLREAVQAGDSREAVRHYLSAKGIGRKMREASVILADAAMRGEVIVTGERDGQRTALASDDWRDRPYVGPTSGELSARDWGEAGVRIVEWSDLRAPLAAVERLRLAPWHSLALEPSGAAASEPQTPRLSRPHFVASPDVLRRAVERTGSDAPTLGAMARAVARLWIEAGGTHSCQSERHLADSIEKGWLAKGLDRERLLALALSG